MSQLKRAKHLKLPLEEIKETTKDFQVNCIGRGGYGMVYKGELIISGKPTIAAIKRLNERSGQGLKEFLTEIQLLCGQVHPNLVGLLGYCDEKKEKIIVYEYAERGSLDMYLRGDGINTLTWLRRLKICIDAARGLEFLHYHVGNHQAIIHRDIKSANILIDENWVAKLSDLGLAKLSLAGLNRSDVVTNVCGTLGYYDPQYGETSIVTKESDVYSFGIVLFEVLSGRLCTKILGNEGFFISPNSVKDYYLSKNLDEIVDPSLKEEMNLESMSRFATIAKGCLHADRGERPKMNHVVKELQKSLELQESFELQKSQLNRLKHLKIPLTEIKTATKNFDMRICEGGHGSVYNGELIIYGKPTLVALKRLHEQHGRELMEIVASIDLLSGQRHPNLIHLLGYCYEENEKIIVYEYAHRGSLHIYLMGDNINVLTWLQRLKICVDAARGLEYLHNHDIIHGNIKSSNILIFGDWVAKLSDIGLAKLSLAAQYRGYDMSSFGIVLFEVLCGKLCTKIDLSHDDGLLVPYKSVKDYYLRKRLDEIVDPNLKKEMNMDTIYGLAAIAKRCLDDDLGEGPPMDLVVKELQELLELQESIELQVKRFPQHTSYYDQNIPCRRSSLHLPMLKEKVHNIREPTLSKWDR